MAQLAQLTKDPISFSQCNSFEPLPQGEPLTLEFQYKLPRHIWLDVRHELH